jgi:DNA-directed RNA polymerase subunit omega
LSVFVPFSSRFDDLGQFLFASFLVNRHLSHPFGELESKDYTLNAELTRKALEKVGNPNVLVNIVSRRVRQLNGGAGGAPARPLLTETAGLGLADIALLEIAEGKLGWEMLEQIEAEETGAISE